MNHPPDPNCERCNGNGEYIQKTKHDTVGHLYPCICIFVTHDDVDEADAMLKMVIKSIIEKS